MNFLSTILGTPDPICFKIGPLEIRWYAVLITFGLVLSFFIMQKRMKKVGIDPELVYDLLLYVVPLGIVCARLYYVAFMWDYYGAHLSEIIMISNGGLAIHGAVIGGIIGGILFAKNKKINFWTVTDIVAPALILGQAIGRWGNYFNQEAYGAVTDSFFSIRVFEAGKGFINVQPTFLYESICDFLIFLFLIFYMDKHKKNEGEVFIAYMILYSVCRFFIEGLRTDSLMFLGLRTAQLVSIAGVLLGVGLLVYFRKRKKNDLSPRK